MVETMTLEWFWSRVEWSVTSLGYLGTQCKQHRLGYKGMVSDLGAGKQRWKKNRNTPLCLWYRYHHGFAAFLEQIRLNLLDGKLGETFTRPSCH